MKLVLLLTLTLALAFVTSYPTPPGADKDDVSEDDIRQIVQDMVDDFFSRIHVKDATAGVDKRGLRDSLRGVFRNITSVSRNAVSNLFDRAGRAWNKLRQKIKDYDIRSRLALIRQRVKSHVGNIYSKLDDTTFKDIVTVTKDTIKHATGVLGLDTFAQKIKGVLKEEVADIPDEEIKDIVQAVEDDLADFDDNDDDDGDVATAQRRGFFDTLAEAFRNITSAGKDAMSNIGELRDAVQDLGTTGRETFSSVVSLASNGWNRLRQKIGDYDVKSHLASIQQRVLDRFGDQAVQVVGDGLVDEIALSAKSLIAKSSDMLDVNQLVGLLRSSLGPVLDAVSDTQIGQLVQGLQDDVTAQDSDEGDASTAGN